MTEEINNDRSKEHAIPYTPDDIADYQKEADVCIGKVVLMDPYRVQASVESAMLRGWHGHEEHVEEQRKQDRRDRLMMVGWAIVIILGFIATLSVLEPFLPEVDPSTVPHVKSE